MIRGQKKYQGDLTLETRSHLSKSFDMTAAPKPYLSKFNKLQQKAKKKPAEQICHYKLGENKSQLTVCHLLVQELHPLN